MTIDDHMGFIINKASLISAMYPTIDIEDLIQEGRIAVWQSTRHYDATRGFSFKAYAGRAAQNAMFHFAKRFARPITINHGVNHETCNPMLRDVRFSAPVGCTDTEYENLFGVAEAVTEAVDDTLTRERLQQALDSLEPKHREVIEARFLKGEKLTVIGKRQGVTKDAIRLQIIKALKTLRKRLTEQHARERIYARHTK